VVVVGVVVVVDSREILISGTVTVPDRNRATRAPFSV